MENDLKPCAYNEKLVRLKDVNDALTAQFMDSPLDSDRWVIGRIQFRVNEIPAVDAVEVVRCDECWFRPKGKTYCIELERHTGDGFYCAFGQRREEEHNAPD